MKVSLTMRVHNEVNLLDESLPNFFKVKADEYLFVFDRCNDGSYEKVVCYASAIKKMDKCRFIKVNVKSFYNFHMAYLMDLIIKESANDLILYSGADIILDYSLINDYIYNRNMLLCDVLIFRLYPKTLGEKLNELLFLIKGGFQGTFIFDRKKLVDNISNSLKVCDAEDTCVIENLVDGSEVISVATKTLHLRPDSFGVVLIKKLKNLKRIKKGY
ncbi:hypothetical protein KJN74_01515 [Candidatus Bathyarchaeota archaeon]|nr:hypothetical protein [Candidatus Bathyarchaeota archaeon]